MATRRRQLDTTETLPVAMAWMSTRPRFHRGDLERYLHKVGVGLNHDMSEARRAAGWILDTLHASHRVTFSGDRPEERMWGLTAIGRRFAQEVRQ